jgi:hypothetical protein
VTAAAAERRPLVELTDAQARRTLVPTWGTVPEDVLSAWVAEMDYALDPVVHQAVLPVVRDVAVRARGSGPAPSASPRSCAA